MASQPSKTLLNRVPEVTIFFWIIKVLATTVGETAADYLNEGMGLGLYRTAAVMTATLLVALLFQIMRSRYVAPIYWLVIVLISIAGTLVTDILTDSLSVPLVVSTTIFAVSLAVVFGLWRRAEGTISIHAITSLPRELFYWLVVLFTFALGTALGDLFAERFELGYLSATGVFALAIGLVALAYKRFGLRETVAFWTVFILTRPLGASFGDLLAQSKSDGGLGLGTMATSILFLVAIVLTVGFTRADRALEGQIDESQTKV